MVSYKLRHARGYVKQTVKAEYNFDTFFERLFVGLKIYCKCLVFHFYTYSQCFLLNLVFLDDIVISLHIKMGHIYKKIK